MSRKTEYHQPNKRVKNSLTTETPVVTPEPENHSDVITDPTVDGFDFTQTDIYQEAISGMPEQTKTLVERFKKSSISIIERKNPTTNKIEKKPSLISDTKNKQGDDGPVGLNLNRLLVTDCHLYGFGRYYIQSEMKFYQAKTFNDNARRDINLRVLPPMRWVIESDKYQSMPNFIDAYIKQNICLLIIVKSVLEEFIDKLMEMPEMFTLEIQKFINRSVGKLYTPEEIDDPTEFFKTCNKNEQRYRDLISNMKKKVILKSEFSGLVYEDVVGFLKKFFGDFKGVTPMIKRVTDSLGTIEIQGKVVPKTLYIKWTSKTYVKETKTSEDGKKQSDIDVPWFPKIVHHQTRHDPKSRKYVNASIVKEVNTDLLEKNWVNLKNPEIPQDKLFPIGIGDCVIVGGVIIINPKPDDKNPHPKLSAKMTMITRTNAAPPLPDMIASGISAEDFMNEFNELADETETNNSLTHNGNNQDHSLEMEDHISDSSVTDGINDILDS